MAPPRRPREGETTPPAFLAVGHAVRDLTPGGWRWGGAAVYAARTAARWGVATALLTAGRGVPRGRGVEVVCKRGPTGTTFVNLYEGGRRRQRLLARAPSLEPEDLPEAWRQASLVVLAPVAQEVSPAFIGLFPRATLAAAIQGWLRAWSPEGIVYPCPLPDGFPLDGLDVLIASREDVEDPGWFTLWARRVPLVVMTMGRAGAILWERGVASPVPTVPVEEVDPTGAGDVFAAVFLLRLGEGCGAREAALWASAAGALCVRRPGLAGVPSRRQVAALLTTPAWQGLRGSPG